MSGNPPGRIGLDADGFTVHGPGVPTGTASILWEDVVRVRAFKPDLGAVDCVCVRFDHRRGRAVEVRADWEGFDALAMKMRQRFSIPADWLANVARPPLDSVNTLLCEPAPQWTVMSGDSMSRSGRFQIDLDEREVFNTCWVGTPTIIDRADCGVVFSFADSHWSADAAAWDGDRVTLTVRKYPGNHTPGDLRATVDCVARTGAVGDAPQAPLVELEAALEAALTWHWARDLPPRATGLQGLLRRFFGN